MTDWGLQILAIVGKDLAMEMRSRERLLAMLVFALLVIMVFGMTLDLRMRDAEVVASGVLWVTISFAGMLGLGRTFAREREEDCLDGLLLCPVDRSVIYVAKMIGNLLFIAIMEMVAVPLFMAIFDLRLPPLVLPVIVLGTVGFAAAGTLLAAMTAQARARDMLLPVMFFPIVLPIQVAAVRLTAGLMGRQPWSGMSHWLHLIIGFDVVLLAISVLCFDLVIEE